MSFRATAWSFDLEANVIDAQTSDRTSARRGDFSQARIPLTRASSVGLVVEFLKDIGAPVDRLLRQSRIPEAALTEPARLIPLNFVHDFIVRAADAEGIDNIGLTLGRRISAFSMGQFGLRLQQASTVYDYLRTGVRLIGEVTTGQRFWLTREGGHLRFNQYIPGVEGAGRCHNDLFVLAVTLQMLRQFIGEAWSPDEICLRAGDERVLGDGAAFFDSPLRLGGTYSSFTISMDLLHRPIGTGTSGTDPTSATVAVEPAPMPEDFTQSARETIRLLLMDGGPSIASVSKAAGVSVRTFQRRLAFAGLDYTELLKQTRFDLAVSLLRNTTIPVAEVAEELGYSDPANFTRAFRRRAGVSPKAFRTMACELAEFDA